MKRKPINAFEAENWVLILFSAITILLNGAVIAVAVLFFENIGWWSLLLVGGGIFSIACAVEAVRRNDPSWILLDLILRN